MLGIGDFPFVLVSRLGSQSGGLCLQMLLTITEGFDSLESEVSVLTFHPRTNRLPKDYLNI